MAATTVDPTTAATTVDPTAAATTVDPTTAATTVDPTTAATTVDPTTAATTVDTTTAETTTAVVTGVNDNPGAKARLIKEVNFTLGDRNSLMKGEMKPKRSQNRRIRGQIGIHHYFSKQTMASSLVRVTETETKTEGRLEDKRDKDSLGEEGGPQGVRHCGSQGSSGTSVLRGGSGRREETIDHPPPAD